MVAQGQLKKLLDHYLHLDQGMLEPLFSLIHSPKKTHIAIKI